MDGELGALFQETFRCGVDSIEPIRADGSNRRIFRIRGGGRSVVGIAHDDHDENAAFLGFSRHFRSLGLPVPEIFAERSDRGLYLETDLGDETLAVRNEEVRKSGRFPDDVEPLYREAVRLLNRFQIEGHFRLDYSLCYQGVEFDAPAIRRDLSYFTDCFLEPLSPFPYDPARLETDFDKLVRRLDGEERTGFLYRDFQSRNMMVVDGRLFFIDYQSGRRGAPHYDLASFLYDAKADLDAGFRERLVDAYLDEREAMVPVDRDRFREAFPRFALIRILQALGAYGNLGIRRGKRRFLESVPYALANLAALLKEERLFRDLPELKSLLERLTESPGAIRTGDG